MKQLRAAGAEKLYRETAGGACADRAQLRRVLTQLDKGDVLMGDEARPAGALDFEIAMTFSTGLRDDETFVIESVAKEFGGTWRVGENPPDAYLTFNTNTVAVEITTLTQHVTDDRGTRPRASDNAAISPLVDDLNAKLHDVIPDSYSIGLVLSTPILKLRKTTADLAGYLRTRLSDVLSFEFNTEIETNGNTVKISLHRHEEIQRKKVWAVATNRHSNPNIALNAVQILEDRIFVKARKCAELAGKQPIWLALFNDYWLADSGTYEQAISCISRNHPFDNILLIHGNGAVFRLF